MKCSSLLKEIRFQEMEGLRIGNAQDDEAKTGVTVLLFDKPARVGIDVSGGGPASREAHLADPLTGDRFIHAIVFSGGSSFGLSSCDGVIAYLEEKGVGYDTGYAKIPLVLGSCIYDLGYGRSDVRPDAKMGYQACVDAESSDPLCGNFGAGTGATVGKVKGMAYASESGLGIYAAKLGDLKMAAIVVVNALGDVYDPETGKEIAGLKGEDGLLDSKDELYRIAFGQDLFSGNTTIGAIVCNGDFNKAEMSKIASMARNAYARCIDPVGTMVDGDTIYSVSMGEVKADINVAGTMAAEVMAKAIIKAVKDAQ